MKPLLCFFLMLMFPVPAILGSRVEVDLGLKYQTIESFGASDAWSIDPAIRKWASTGDEKAIEHLANLLFSTAEGIGLSAWRFNIGAGSSEQGEKSRIPDPYRRAELFVSRPGGEVDHSKQAGQVRLLKEAHERGVSEFVAFVNSPPVWATKNGLSHPSKGEGVGSSNLDPKHLHSFADFLSEVITYLRSEYVGVPVNHLSPVNEPTWEWEGESQEGNRYNMDELKAVYKSVHASLKKSGLSEVIHLDGAEAVEYTAALSDPYKLKFDDQIYNGGMNKSLNGLYRNYIDELLGDPEMRSILGNKLSMHGYFSDANSERMNRLRDLTLKSVQKVSPDAKLWMSEFCIMGEPGDVRSFSGPGFDPLDMELALHVARVIHRDLTRLNVSAWHWWLAMTPYDYKDGLIKVDPDLAPESVTPSKLMWALGNYSRFIRPGFKRVALSGADNINGVAASAYLSGDSSQIVLIAINSGHKDEELMIDFTNGGSFQDTKLAKSYLTNKYSDLVEHKGDEEIVVPARSVITYIFDTL
ncbi:glycoside hydrolase [Pelagicoccus mobilis]|nr:glycoside hydrolase [Pelagicoccus mobilis]